MVLHSADKAGHVQNQLNLVPNQTKPFTILYVIVRALNQCALIDKGACIILTEPIVMLVF